MNSRTCKKSRSKVKPIRLDMEAKAFASMTIPLWRRIAYRLGIRGPYILWVKRWRKNCASVLDATEKKTAQKMARGL